MRIIITGGTFDKLYDPIQGQLTFRESHLPEILAQLRCGFPIELETNRLIDSLEMGDAERESVRDACLRASERRIIITHGTDTMGLTAALLGNAKGLSGKHIVLTGAMVPYSVSGSDALFNLGCAIAFVQACEPGVYIAMNGRVFPWDRVAKNRKEGKFEGNALFSVD